MATLSALVLNYRTPFDAVRSVQALLRQTAAADLEIFVIDNHSRDESIQFLRNRLGRDPRVHIVETARNLGYGSGNNLALTRLSSEYVLIINPDNELEPEGLEKMVAAMNADPSIGILAPQLVHDDRTIRDSYRTFPTMTDVFIKRTFLRRIFRERMRRYLQQDQDPWQIRDVDWVVGACLLIRRSLLEEIGGFDPRFFLFFEDTDLCRRSWNAGKRVVYFPQAHATDRKKRLSEGGPVSLFFKRAGRAHVTSAIRYFSKWRGA